MRDQPKNIKAAWSEFEFEFWSSVALHVVCFEVRILACPEFQTNEHPLLDELSRYFTTHHITTGAGSDFPIVVFGDVVRFEGEQRKVVTTATRGNEETGLIHSITVRTPRRKVAKTVKGIISVSGSDADPLWH